MTDIHSNESTNTATPVFGIDLGTTYSCIAYIDEFGKPVVPANELGDHTTPSVIYFESAENRVIGKEAKNNAVLFPDNVVEMVKRQMGLAGWSFTYEDVQYSAEEISSYILRKLVDDAQAATGHTITDVVITCPAYFGINEREATAKAGEIAGLNVRNVLNEPTAAAISYGMDTSANQVILVYDLGGGTFDCTMIEIHGGNITTIATGGDYNLGGRNWDEAIVKYLAEEWMRLAGSDDDPMDDPETLQDLWMRAEDAKKSLTPRNKATVAVAHVGNRQRVELTREKFEALTEHLLQTTIDYTHKMLEEAKKKGIEEFDQILLVGGSTKMPCVSQRLQAEFGKEPLLFDPDESVAKGAALFGQKLSIEEAVDAEIERKKEELGIDDDSPALMPSLRESAEQEVADQLGVTKESVAKQYNTKIVNVSSHSFGMVAVADKATMEEKVFNLILMNAPVPADVTRNFYTLEDNQYNVEIKIMENILSDDQVEIPLCEKIGDALLPLPKGLPERAPIEVTFQLNEQGRLHVLAREVSQNFTIEVEIDTSRIISQELLEEAKARSTQIVIS
ncbi:MAG: Hsp70 family protein [Chloroflexota bacterium]